MDSINRDSQNKRRWRRIHLDNVERHRIASYTALGLRLRALGDRRKFREYEVALWRRGLRLDPVRGVVPRQEPTSEPDSSSSYEPRARLEYRSRRAPRLERRHRVALEAIDRALGGAWR